MNDILFAINNIVTNTVIFLYYKTASKSNLEQVYFNIHFSL